MVVDRTAPTLQRWYLHRERASVAAYFFFDEPVRLVDEQALKVYYTTRNAAGTPIAFGTIPMSLFPPHTAAAVTTIAVTTTTTTTLTPTMKYTNSNRQLVVQLLNYCRTSGETAQDAACLASRDPSQNLFAFLNQTTTITTIPSSSSSMGYFLTMAAGALEDFAEKPNPSLQIVERRKVLEGGPGKFYCSFC